MIENGDTKMNNNKDKIMLFRKLVVSLIAILALLVIGVIIQGLNNASSGEEKDDSITIIESTTKVEPSKTEAVKVDAATEREAEVKDDDNSTVEDASTTSAQDDVITTAEIFEEEKTTAIEEVTAKEEKTTAKEKKTTAAKEENTEAVADYRFRNNKLLSQHYDKHGKEMGFASKEDYEAAAAAVVVNPNALHKTEKEDGDDIYYIEETNEFVVVSTDGYIRTYFNPSGGIKYYNRQ